ncbi:hypothetical protein ACR42A_12615 [Burkholderia gladioli]|uniref:hypothetical protein n=1 Tax=Burkholderia gladioli TaxID=28095 RepID=UPI00163FE400|nr:hypothetical protein [Burkholderia gladioli]
MTRVEIRIPVTEIRVKYRAGKRRPITELDRMVMQSITAGASSVDRLKPIFQLPERLLVECLVDLMDMALLALDTSGSGFRLTEFGELSLAEDMTSFGERVDDADETTFLREDLTGRMAPGQIIRYDREKADMRSADVQGSIPHGEIEQFLIQKLKKDREHLHSVESVVPIRDGISFKVTVDRNSISGLPSQWSHLKQLIQAEAEVRTGLSYAPPEVDRENEQEDPLWTEIGADTFQLLLRASDHEKALAQAIEQARSRLLILSAHVSETVLDQLKEPIKAAIDRGVRIDVLWGLPSLDETGEPHAKATKKWVQEVRKSLSDGNGDNLAVNEEPLNSDAKILIWDSPDGAFQAIVGSYNWLYGQDGPSAGCTGSEVGIRLSAPRLVGNICTTLSGWLDARGQLLDGIALRWRNIGLSLAQTTPPPPASTDIAALNVRVLYDESHAEVLREGLVNATKRLLVTSHKLNRSATGSPVSGGGKLDWLAKRNSTPELQFALVTGKSPKRETWTQEDQGRLEQLVKGVGGSLRLAEGTHARVLVYDDVAVVSSYNFLSTTHGKRQVGVMFRGPRVADSLWEAFKAIDT